MKVLYTKSSRLCLVPVSILLESLRVRLAVVSPAARLKQGNRVLALCPCRDQHKQRVDWLLMELIHPLFFHVTSSLSAVIPNEAEGSPYGGTSLAGPRIEYGAACITLLIKHLFPS